MNSFVFGNARRNSHDEGGAGQESTTPANVTQRSIIVSGRCVARCSSNQTTNAKRLHWLSLSLFIMFTGVSLRLPFFLLLGVAFAVASTSFSFLSSCVFFRVMRCFDVFVVPDKTQGFFWRVLNGPSDVTSFHARPTG